MRLRKRMLFLVLVILALGSVSAGAMEVKYDIDRINLYNVVAPDGFGVCTLDECDSEFKAMLKQFNHTYEEWLEKIMIPGDIFMLPIKKMKIYI